MGRHPRERELADDEEFENPANEEVVDLDDRRGRGRTDNMKERPNRPLSRPVSNYSGERPAFDGFSGGLAARFVFVLVLGVAGVLWPILDPMPLCPEGHTC